VALGVRAAVSDSAILAKARAALSGGPLNGPELLAHVLAVPRASINLAERMLRVLLGDYDEFARQPDGSWRLAEKVGATATIDASLAPLESSFVVVDVETTGGSALHGHRMTEFAAVPVDRGIVGTPYTTLLNPGREIMPMVVSLTGITAAMVRTAPLFPDVADAILASLQGRVFVGHNAGFDWRFTAYELEQARGIKLEGDRLCTVRLVRAVLPHLGRRSLDHVAYYFGVPIHHRHRAYGDATATAHVLVKLLQAACDRGWDTWPALQRGLERRSAKARRRRRSAMPRSIESIPFND
jgi:DNA polymerase III epsilon subunit family exonuclease